MPGHKTEYLKELLNILLKANRSRLVNDWCDYNQLKSCMVATSHKVLLSNSPDRVAPVWWQSLNEKLLTVPLVPLVPLVHTVYCCCVSQHWTSIKSLLSRPNDDEGHCEWGGRGVSLLAAAAVSDAGEEWSDLQSKAADIIYNCWAGSSQIEKKIYWCNN